MRPTFLALSLIFICHTAICQSSTTTASDSTTAVSPTKDSAAIKDSTSTMSPASMSRKEKDKWAKSLKPDDGKALVYIVRPSAMGSLIHMKVRCDSVPIGTTSACNYVYAMLEPGKHTLTSHAENWAALDIVVEAGKVYYVKQRSEMGALYAETDLELLEEKDGQKYLKKCEIAKDNVATNAPPKK